MTCGAQWWDSGLSRLGIDRRKRTFVQMAPEAARTLVVELGR
jgi:hypothetical protein